ncbi:MAG: hypothetical protein KDA31_05240 [Phycisphaerales bacterium]|nr:hypothetical protein [Phycisphaerales bacterium]MCB9836361.1 hypothetical protein [Phycisphaera sp.]
MTDPRPAWPERLRRAALSTLVDDTPARIADLATGSLNDLPVARLLAITLGAKLDPPAREPKSLDEQLWSALAGLCEAPLAPGSLHGPITGEYESGAIEVWTETELACVHAAWSLGPAWQQAACESARWLLGNIQPDNATNHPWAVHAFAKLAEETGNIEFDLYAQTLLHNCIVGQGRPDDYSALILLHASRAIQAG